MCSPDMTPVTLFLLNGTDGHGPLAPGNRDVGVHQCADWNMLDGWVGASERKIDMYRLDLLRAPDKGLEYSD
jgi:hypothetical protein